MLISVVNHCEYTDEYVQEVLRAINRQITEDFEPYWHRSGELRLEGAVGRFPNPKNPKELRGDAVIYLWDRVDQEEALGYHDLNFRGIPFSIVFTALSEKMKENWTVTLSHEALELVMDPEANLLVHGPHPEDPGRRVYHWYEMCDAVQTQTYSIDDVEVSNFVLPLYFTEDDEKGSRNDFLGLESHDGPLRSFGVADGGYVGFFDPATGEHDQFESPHGGTRERLAKKKAAGWARRAVRRQYESSPEPVLQKILERNPNEPLPGPWFEGFAVDVRARGDADPYDVLEAAAAAVLGADWDKGWLAVEPTQPRDNLNYTPYELIPKGARLTVEEAWDRCYAFREQAGVVDVEPDFVFFRADSEAILDLPPKRRMALFGSAHLEASQNCEWSLEQVRAKQAWVLSKGERIAIGHPDTGFLPHPEVWPSTGDGPIDTHRDYDFVADDDDARAEPDENDLLPGGPSHGTSTASVIVSAEGRANSPNGNTFVSGIAPEATLIPLRVSNSVVHFSMRRVRKAIEYAVQEGLQVLSMSLGGPFPSRRLHRTIKEAERAGVILIAAAGNNIPFRPVIWPARYPEVIAVAACNVDEKPWSGSSRGEKIDATAPGESVWRALVDESATGAARFRVERSSGTSYATATVAGVCALWLSYHGWRPLYQKYGARLTDAFRHMIDQNSRQSDDLPADDFGPGIVDAEAILRAPLPSKQALSGSSRGRRARRAKAATAHESPLAIIEALHPHLTPDQIRYGLEALFDTDSRGLTDKVRELGDELAFQFARDARFSRQFSANCRKSGPVRARGARVRSWDAAAFGGLRGHLQRMGSRRLRENLK